MSTTFLEKFWLSVLVRETGMRGWKSRTEDRVEERGKKDGEDQVEKKEDIKSFDCRQEFDEAWSLVDENFVYRRGEWVYADAFTDDRWKDSTHGIHFWMTREEAMEY